MEPFEYLNVLHFDTIIRQLQEMALSDRTKEQLALLQPFQSEIQTRLKMQETTSARAILDASGVPPLTAMDSVTAHLHHAQTGGMLLPDQLCAIACFASACRRTADHLKRCETMHPDCVHVAVYGRGFHDLTDLRKRIEQSVNEDGVYDDASPALKDIRRRMNHLHSQIREKLDHVLKSKKEMLADNYISIRGDHYVLPVLRRYKNEFGGTVIEASSKGSTLFMEPTAIRKLQEELSMLMLEEDSEIRRILYTLSGETADEAAAIENNLQLMEQLDMVFAKAKLSAAMNARAVEISSGRTLKICQGRHPLLAADSCVPLDLAMEDTIDGLVITGPNTGGKTVAMKTVGLLCAMAQSGLHIPCADGTLIPMHDRFLCDIGDNQSLTQNLSTFSGHISNVIRILQTASRDSLVLLDELGSGTDPAEGMGIAIAVLQELWLRKCRYIVTTHDPEVKQYAASTTRVLAARMAFDRETLRPLYRLETGKTGESCALYIAQRLGMPMELLERARKIVYDKVVQSPPLTPAFQQPASMLIRPRTDCTAEVQQRFAVGDAVILQPDGTHAIVFQPADDKGMVIVQIKGEKQAVNHKRLQLHIPASQLYPPDYDFSILFDTVANRKATHILSKRYDESATVIHKEGRSTH